jgi:hypothetical protein
MFSTKLDITHDRSVLSASSVQYLHDAEFVLEFADNLLDGSMVDTNIAPPGHPRSMQHKPGVF